jgi:hypothetical protein
MALGAPWADDSAGGHEGSSPSPHWPTGPLSALPEGILTGEQPQADDGGRRCVFDIEGDGLLYAEGSKKQVTQLWCLAAQDLDTGEEFYWGIDRGPESIEQGLRFLAGCSVLIGHNAIGYDYPAIERLYPWWQRPAKAWDSLVIAKCTHPADALAERDFALNARGKLPMQYVKRHSLAAWGYRTGTYKQEYTGGFDRWTPEMAVYLMHDVRANVALWRVLERAMGWSQPVGEKFGAKEGVDHTKAGILRWPEAVIQTECDVARIIHEQWECGIRFDMPKAIALAATLRNHQARIEQQLIDTFGSWWEPQDDIEQGYTALGTTHRRMVDFPSITSPRVSPKTGKALKPYTGPPLEECCEGDTYVRIKRVTFDPASRMHLGQRLQAIYGWKPKAWGGKNKDVPTVDEGTLAAIPEAVLPPDIRKLILDYFVVSKTRAMLDSGPKAWIRMAGGPRQDGDVRVLGRIHGEMDTVGAITRRAAHKNPNLGQVPAVTKDKQKHVVMGLEGGFGWECRELFTADDGEEQTGVDASALELITLGHYLYPHDGGAFSHRVCDPVRDPHQEHADITGLTRGDVKTATYLKVYGGSAYKLSLNIGIDDDEVIPNLGYRGLPMLLDSLVKRFDQTFVDGLDDKQKAKIAKARQIIIKLEAGITGLVPLTEALQGNPRKHIIGAASKGWLKGLDGSKIIVRKDYAALNALLQSAGAMACKLWMVLTHKALEARGLHKGVHWKQVLWVHDELQFTHRPGLGPVIKEVAEACMVQAGEMLGLRGRFRTDGKTGRNWAECH